MYNKLKEHLYQTITINKINESTTENSSKSWWAISGGFFARFLQGTDEKKEKEKKDPITAELERQQKEAENNAKKREEALINAKENAFAQKLAAKYEAKQNKLTLANQRKVAAWNGKANKAKIAAEYWKKNKLERTQAEMDAWEAELEKSFSAMGDNGYTSDQERFNTAIYITAWHEDGTMRTPEEINFIKDLAKKKKNDSNYDPASDNSLTPVQKDMLAKNKNWEKVSNHLTTIDSIVAEHGEEITDAMKDGKVDYPALLTSIQGAATKKASLIKDAEEAENLEKQFNANAEAITAVEELRKERETKIQQKEKAEAIKQGYDSKKPTGVSVTNGVAEFTGGKSEISSYINSVLDDPDIKNKNSTEKTEAIRKKLKEMGIPQNHIDNILPAETNISNMDDNEFKNHLKNNVDGLNDDAIEKVRDGISKKIKANYDKAVSDINSINTDLENMYDPSKGPEDETNKSWLEAHKNEPIADKINTYNEIPEQDRNPNGTYFNEAEKARITDATKAAKKALADEESAEKARKQHIIEKQAMADSAEAYENLPQDIKDKIETKLDELGEGEVYNKAGKIGYYDEKNNFHEKPGTDNEEESNKYVAGRRRAMMLKTHTNDAQQITSIASKPETGGANKGKYKVTIDGKEQYLSADEIADIKASHSRNENNKAISDDYKMRAAEVLKKKCLGSNGKIDPEKVKALKDEDAELVALLATLQKEGKLEDAYKAIGDMGNTTYNSLTKTLGDTKLHDIINTPDTTPEPESETETELNISADDIEDGYEVEGDDGTKYIKRDGNFYKKDANGEEEVDFDKWLEDVEKHVAAEDIDDLEDEAEDEVGKQKQDPRKVWKPLRYKRGDKTYTSKKTYVNKKGDRLSKSEFEQRVKNYEKHKNRQQQSSVGPESFHYTNLGNHLFESINEVEITVKTYTKLSKYLSDTVN